MPLVYTELRAMAANYLRRERPDHTLQPTALVHEAFLRLAGDKSIDRAHFMAMAAVAMRNVLVDHARRHAAAKRSTEGKRLSFGAPELATTKSDMDVLELDDLLLRLAKLDARRARVVELKVFAAMTNDEIAHVLGIARSTVAEDWTVAKAWLAAELADDAS
ncbi:MAG: sigma-70 family RNA polymerase sigma factor [Anaerolineae bacterium]|nr:sigma-70 family RNA polymerase sigma factor [Phycisphaerae bacterium]